MEINDNNNPEHWGFLAVQKTLKDHGQLEKYTCASGITPSGVIHIGNVREYITVDIVKRAFVYSNLNVRHIHSWDDNDVFRKVPKNMPQPEMLEKHLRMCIVDVPDPYGVCGCYAMKHIKDLEESVKRIGINPEFLYQCEKYRNCEYAEQINHALKNNEKIKEILNRYKSEDVDENWLPISIFCGNCKKDTIDVLKYTKDYHVYYECKCGHKEEIDFRKVGIVKLKWRIDWPMRWAYEKVNFEPGGRDHSSAGGSYDTGKDISREVWNHVPPTYILYEFIKIKGATKKISSSAGNVVTLSDCLEVYEPEVMRYIFAGTRPEAEFEISFDTDVIKIYEDYDKCERAYYGVEETSKPEKEKWNYIFSQVNENVEKIPKEMATQVGFRHITTMLQINELNEEKTLNFFKNKMEGINEEKLKVRIKCAKNWLEKYADEQFKFSVLKTKVNLSEFSELEQNVLRKLKEKIEISENEEELTSNLFEIPKETGMNPKDFFKLCYKVIINKERGPKLASFIWEVGKDKVLNILDF